MTIYAQGDILIIRRDAEPAGQQLQATATDASDPPRGSARGLRNRKDVSDPLVLAEGEVTGHHHSLYGRAVMFRDDAIGWSIPSDLYIGTVKVAEKTAALTHPEHDTILLAPGTYEIRRQREYHAGEARRVQD